MSRYLNKELDHAIRKGDFDRAVALVEKGADLTHLTDGFTPLSRASYHGWLQIVEFLITCGSEVDAGAEDGANAVFWGCVRGHDDVVQALLLAGASPNPMRSEGKYSALHAAISQRHGEAARSLVDAGASTDHKYQGKDAVARAAEEGLSDLVAYMRRRRRRRGDPSARPS